MKFPLRSTSLLSIVFLISPLFAFPLILIEIYNRKKYAFVYLALFMSLIAYLWLPSGDLYRYYQEYISYKSMSLKDFSENSGIDIIVHFFIFIMAQMKVEFALIRFVLCFISYLLLFHVFDHAVRNNIYINKNKKMIFILFISFFLLLRFPTFLTGHRFYFAFSIFLFACYHFYFYKKKYALFLLLTVSFIHFSFAIPVLILLASKICFLKINKITFILLLLFMFAISNVIVSSIMSYLPFDNAVKQYLDFYLTGYWGGEAGNSGSSLKKIANFFISFAIYPSFFLCLAHRFTSDLKPFLFFLLVIAIVYFLHTLFLRYSLIAVFLFYISFIKNYNYIYKKRALLMLLIAATIVYSSSIYEMKRQLIKGYQISIACPVLIILNIQYTDYWIRKNIYSDGDIILNN